MNITLVHFIIPCIDSIIAKNFYKRIFGFSSTKSENKTIFIKVNEKLKFELEESDDYVNNHYIFELDQEFFDTIILNLKKENLSFGDDINHLDNKKIKTTSTKKELFFIDPNSHLFELYTNLQ